MSQGSDQDQAIEESEIIESTHDIPQKESIYYKASKKAGNETSSFKSKPSTKSSIRTQRNNLHLRLPDPSKDEESDEEVSRKFEQDSCSDITEISEGNKKIVLEKKVEDLEARIACIHSHMKSYEYTSDKCTIHARVRHPCSKKKTPNDIATQVSFKNIPPIKIINAPKWKKKAHVVLEKENEIIVICTHTTSNLVVLGNKGKYHRDKLREPGVHAKIENEQSEKSKSKSIPSSENSQSQQEHSQKDDEQSKKSEVDSVLTEKSLSESVIRENSLSANSGKYEKSEESSVSNSSLKCQISRVILDDSFIVEGTFIQDDFLSRDWLEGRLEGINRENLNNREITEDFKPVCKEEKGSVCDCLEMLRQNEEWKSEISCLLEQIILHIHGNQCPISLINALKDPDPAVRREAVKELFNTIFLNESGVNGDNKQELIKDDKEAPPEVEKETSLEDKHEKQVEDEKRSSHKIPMTFPQYPPYPRATFESDSNMNVKSKWRESRARCSDYDVHHSKQINIVCPAGTRPIIHICPPDKENEHDDCSESSSTDSE